MSVLKSIREQLAPIHPEGYIFVGGFVVATLVFSAGCGRRWAGSASSRRCWCAYFFRDPARVTPLRERSRRGAGRRARLLRRPRRPAAGLGLGGAPLPRDLDFHVGVRLPRESRAGRGPRGARSPTGRACSSTPISTRRARTTSATASSSRRPPGAFGVVQIAGLVARRIVCFTQRARSLGAGDRFGLIRFGSRVDVYLPERARIVVGLDSRCVAGETVIAQRRRATSRARQFRKS